jgi:hypothetical protein
MRASELMRHGRYRSSVLCVARLFLRTLALVTPGTRATPDMDAPALVVIGSFANCGVRSSKLALRTSTPVLTVPARSRGDPWSESRSNRLGNEIPDRVEVSSELKFE